MNGHEKWQAHRRELIAQFGKLSQSELVKLFYSTDNSTTKLALYSYLFDNFDRPFNLDELGNPITTQESK